MLASTGVIFAASKVKIGNLYYYLNSTSQTASVESQNSTYPRWSTNITSANIPSSVTYNGSTYIVTSISDFAFSGCTNLAFVSIPESVTKIYRTAFSGCTSLSRVNWNCKTCRIEDVSSYRDGLFYNLREQIISFVFGDQVEVIPGDLCSGMKNLNTIEIPNSVLSIGSYAFSGCSSLSSITMGNSITTIGNYAFYGCSNLSSITMGNSVINIGQYAFGNCSGLTLVVIPDSITTIGANAFNGCSGLSMITIGKNITSIGTKAFNDCNNISSIVWEARNYTDFSSYSASPFYNVRGQISSFTFGDEVEHIPSYLCYGMTELTSVSIPNNVISIGNYAFAWCDGLASMVISDSVTSIGNSAFYGCSDLRSLKLGNNITDIGECAFRGCNGLTAVEIPNSTLNIGNNAFGECNNILSVIWNAQKCTNFSSDSSSPFYNIRNKITSFTFGEGVEHIPSYLCYKMMNLTSITIPNNVSTIGNYAFAGCTGLTSIEIPNSVTSIGNYAFNGCSGVTSVTIGNNVTTIGDYAFQNCTALASIEIPNSVTSVGNYAFNGCSSVTAVSIGNNVSTIGDYVFAGCSGLVSIEIPNSVTSVGNYAFNGCSGLASVTIGNNVSNIGDYAFNFSKVWPDYTSIIFKNETPCTLGESPFPSRYKLYIPCGSLNTYKAVWSNYTTYELPTHVKTSITPQYSGYISIPDSASECRSYTIKAISYDHWHFIGWSDGINDSIREVDGAIDTTLTAIFEKDKHEVEITTEDSIKGIVTGSGNYEYGDNITIEALPEYGYHFSHWSDKDAEYDSQVPADAISASRASRLASYLDEEKSSDEKYTIIGYIVGAYGYYNNSYWLSDTPNGSGDFIIFKAKNTATKGSLVKVNAYLYNYYGTYETLQNTAEITEITQNALDNPRKVHITRDTTFTAYFESNKYTITVTGDDEGWYYGGGEYDYLSSCTIYAEAGYGYSFTQWSDGNTDNPRVVVLTQDTTFTAQYEYITSGTCGNNYVLTWSYDRENTTLTISGNGALDEHYTFGAEAPRNMTKLVIEDGVTNIGSTAFDYCYSLTSVTIPNSATSIGNSAFEGCRSLTSVIIPTSVTNIGQSAFEGCRSLTSVEIPSSVTNVGNRAFANCPLEKVYWGVADQADYAKEDFSSVGIKVGLDASNLNWSSVYLYAWTNSGTTISSAWPGTKVNIDESGLYTYTFSSSYSTVNIIWNNGTDQTMDITNVSTSGIYTLTSSSGTNISYNTRPFEGKSLSPFVNSTANISEFTIGENVTRIPALLCEGAGNLTELTIPNSVTAIGESAFDGCSALTTLTLGESITSYGTNTFAGCSNLASIYNYRERPAKLGAGTFDGVDYFNCTLYVLANSVNMYKSSGSDWKDFYFVEPIGATSTTTDEVVVTPHDNTADIVWPTISGAASYKLEIKDIDGNLICTLIFNANGQLTSLAFHAPARNNAPQQAQTAGFQFTITGLEIATRYTYTMQVKDASSQVIAEYSGTFGTTGATEIHSGINNISTTNVSQKIMSNGQIYILRGDKTYTLQGQEVK